MGLLLTKLHAQKEESVESDEFEKYLKTSAIGRRLCDCSEDCEIRKFNDQAATEMYAENFESIKNGIFLDSYARQSNNLTYNVEKSNEAFHVDDSDESMYDSTSSLPLQSSATLQPNQNCEMCSNYEECIAVMKHNEFELEQQLEASKDLIERYRKNLTRERLYRQSMEYRYLSMSFQTENEMKRLKWHLDHLENLFEIYREHDKMLKAVLRKEIILMKLQNEKLLKELMDAPQKEFVFGTLQLRDEDHLEERWAPK